MIFSEPNTDGSADLRLEPEQALQCSKRELLAPALLTVTFRYLLKVVPFGTLVRLLGLRLTSEAATQDPLPQFVQTVRDRITYVSRHYPMLGDCMPQCFAAGTLLRLRGIASTLHFGVIKSPSAPDHLQAHAWLSSGDIVIAGNGSRAVYQELGYRTDSATQRREGEQ